MLIAGKQHSPDRAQQERDFSALRYGKITPTDIDAIIEYHDKGYIIIEVKLAGIDVQYGQYLALVRLCDDLQKNKPTILILARHNYPPDVAIDFSNCDVEKYRYDYKWVEWAGKVKKLVDNFIERKLS